jgi:hypothetical protein
MTTSPWKVLVKSWTYAQEAVITTWCGDQQRPCSQPNPLAGTIDYQMHLDNPPAVSNLEVLFRSAGHDGVHEVRLP